MFTKTTVEMPKVNSPAAKKGTRGTTMESEGALPPSSKRMRKRLPGECY